jgi:uncharacterized protein
MSAHLELARWRRTVAEMYASLRRDDRPGAERAETFRAAKDRLFADHPSSPIPLARRASFEGLAYWPYRPELALVASLEPDPDAPAPHVPRSGDGGQIPFTRIGWVTFEIDGATCRLSVLWLNEYAGGLFIPFQDGTSGSTTYGGGRYLWDSAKGADLGSRGGELVLDFNFAYHPSCVYDPIWSCPLAPPENRLTVPIEAGERLDAEATHDH